MVLKLGPAPESPRQLVKHRILYPSSRDSDSVGLGWCLTIISNISQVMLMLLPRDHTENQ